MQLARRATAWWIIHLLFFYLTATATAQVTLTDITLAADASPAAAAQPALLGADGPEFTQVEAAQRMGYSGKGIKICVIDQGVQVTNPNFGQCRSPGVPEPPVCRIYFGYNAEMGSNDPSPTYNDLGHGMHVSGIAVGSFPDKLLDQKGVPLPYQRGVAYEALLGAINAASYSGLFYTDSLEASMRKSVQEDCDIVNLSVGLNSIEPYSFYTKFMKQAADNDIVFTTAAGNRLDRWAGVQLFDVNSPGAFGSAVAVANLNNTANPAAVQRADSRASICDPTCKDINFPLTLSLFRLENTPGCTTPQPVTNDDVIGAAVVLQITKPCVSSLRSGDMWRAVRGFKPAMVLLAMPTEEHTFVGSLTYSNNMQVPVMWLRVDDGAALSAALKSQSSAAGGDQSPLLLMSLPGAIMADLPAAYARQPAQSSAVGPAFDLSMKPDISAPGSLYSSLPEETYQTWRGTSMAAPYIAGVVGLWMQKQKESGVSPTLSGGWVTAAFNVLKNTAKLVDYPNSNKAWPTAKVGAGVVQAQSAVLTTVTITPSQILLQTDKARQTVTLTLTNSGDRAVSYRLGHKAAVTVSINKAWYGAPFDVDAPNAELQTRTSLIRVPARGTLTVQVTIVLPEDLQARNDAIISGYITFKPTKPTIVTYKPLQTNVTALQPMSNDNTGTFTVASLTGAEDFSSSSSSSSSSSTLKIPDGQVYVTLSVPYQGASRDYSSFGNNSLALLPTREPSLNPAASRSLAGMLSVCVISPGAKVCRNNINKPGVVQITAGDLRYGDLNFVAPLLRPVKRLRVQVLSAQGRLLGYSTYFGPCATAQPLELSIVPFDVCEQTRAFDGSYTTPRGQSGRMQRGKRYKFKLEFTAYVAAGDAAAGRIEAEPFVVGVRGTVQVV